MAMQVHRRGYRRGDARGAVSGATGKRGGHIEQRVLAYAAGDPPPPPPESHNTPVVSPAGPLRKSPGYQTQRRDARSLAPGIREHSTSAHSEAQDDDADDAPAAPHTARGEARAGQVPKGGAFPEFGEMSDPSGGRGESPPRAVKRGPIVNNWGT
eukprot:1015648-Prorocentrum_minimum.AAC.1